jgi:hypothetical protein
MTEPTTADREAAHAALANYWHSNNPAANADMARQVARFLATARAEERERCAKIADAESDRIMAIAREPYKPGDYGLAEELECQAAIAEDIGIKIRSQE